MEVLLPRNKRYSRYGGDITPELAKQRCFRSCIFCKDWFVSNGGFRSHLTRFHYQEIYRLRQKYGLRKITGRFGEY